MIFKKMSNRVKLVSAVTIAICACAVFIIILSRRGADNSSKIIKYTALGDSIAKGYTVSEDDDLKGYPRLLAEDMERDKVSVSLSEYTKNGLTTEGLCEIYLSDIKVREDLKEADLITVTIGANDLLKKFRQLYQEVIGGDIETQKMGTVLENIRKEAADNPEFLEEAAEIIGTWDCDAFEKDWKRTMESIRRNRNEDTQVIVTTIYNPVGEIEALGVLNQMIAKTIGRMNQVIIGNSEEYGYQTADLSEAEIEEHLQPDEIHPDQYGQRMIMEIIKEKYQKKH